MAHPQGQRASSMVPPSSLKSRTVPFQESGFKHDIHRWPSVEHSSCQCPLFATVIAARRAARLASVFIPSGGIMPRAPSLHPHYRDFLATMSPCAGPGASPSLGFMRPCGAGLCPSASHGTFPALTHQPSQSAAPHTPVGRQGVLVHSVPCRIGLRRVKTGSAPDGSPRTRFAWGFHFGAADIRLSCGPLVCSPFVSLPPACASGKGFVTRDCHRFVASSAVGSAIRPNWTIAGVGLSPTG